jgi:hypothetical protein
MGHRVELAEIDAAATRAGAGNAVCVYEPERRLLALFYTGPIEIGDLAKLLRKTLPDFMTPRRFCRVDSIPTLSGGKPDRVKLLAMTREL